MNAHSFGLVSMETEEKAEKQRWTWVGRDTENKEQKKLFIKRGLPQTNQQLSQNQQICILDSIFGQNGNIWMFKHSEHL